MRRTIRWPAMCGLVTTWHFASVIGVDAPGDPAQTPVALLVIAGIILVALTAAGFVGLYRERQDRLAPPDDVLDVDDEPDAVPAVTIDLREAPRQALPALLTSLQDRAELRIADPWEGPERRGRATGGRQLSDPWQQTATDDPESALCAVDGIGPAIARRLAELGITSLEALAATDAKGAASLREGLGRYGWMLARDDWIGQARRLVDPDEPFEATGGD
jgi:predicted flap endonuclease-1-like 5' DNA nuclease